MADDNWIEVAVFIHGITPERNPKEQGNNNKLYDILFDDIQTELERQGKKPLDDAIRIIWNWNPGDNTPPLHLDQNLAEAERLIGDQIGEREQHVNAINRTHFMLWKLIYKIGREIMLYGLADAMYYVSQDGEQTVREHVFKSLCDEIMRRLDKDETAKISLTVLGHSAGSLIAHDFLYQLFSNRKQKKNDVAEVHHLRSLVGEGERQGDTSQPYARLRVRHLYTFGSPIAAWFIRANSLLAKVMDKEPLKVADLGFMAQDGLSNPRWVNFWALTDVASFPLSFLYDDQEIVKDEYVDPGLVFPSTHTAYWRSPKAKIAERIARSF